MINTDDIPLESGDFILRKGYDDCITLFKKDYGVLMSNSNSIINIYKNSWNFDNFYGDILILGLGLGIIEDMLENNMKVNSITFIEVYPDVIKMLEPYLSSKLICDDVFVYTPIKKYDHILIDIFHTAFNNIIIDGNMEERKRELYRKYTPYLKEGGSISHNRIGKPGGGYF